MQDRKGVGDCRDAEDELDQGEPTDPAEYRPSANLKADDEHQNRNDLHRRRVEPQSFDRRHGENVAPLTGRKTRLADTGPLRKD